MTSNNATAYERGRAMGKHLNPQEKEELEKLFEDAWEILHSSRTLINTDASAWREYAGKALLRHGIRPTVDVCRWACQRLLHAQFKGGNEITGVQAEVLPMYLGLYEWAASGFPHFTLCPDFFHAVAVTDFGDPTDEPFHLPFNSFSISFPKTSQFGMASRAFVYRIASILPGDKDDLSYERCNIDWVIHRATLMTERTVMTQWPVNSTRAEILNEILLSQRLADVTQGVVSGPGGEGQETAVLRSKLEIADMLMPLSPEQRVKVLTGVQRSVIETPLKDSSAGKSGGMYRTLSGEEAQRTLMLRTMLANVMSYIEAAGDLPTSARTHGAPAAAVERVHKTQPNFDVGRIVKLDGRTRQALTLGVSDAHHWKLMQKFMVRGHWRNQVHGVGRALRRRQWIAPFYKGPENVAEALSRTYEVT